MSTLGNQRVGYAEAARRHFADAGLLLSNSREANAGQLFGLAAECGLKAIVVACGAKTDADGSVDKLTGVKGKGFKDHMPQLHQAAITYGGHLPDGRFSTRYLASMPSLSVFSDWAVEHRYWRNTAWPAASLPKWKTAADEVMLALDQAQKDGVL